MYFSQVISFSRRFQITLDKNNFSEREIVGHCFGIIKTVAEADETFDRHTLSLTANPHDRLKISQINLCLKKAVDFEGPDPR